MVSKDPVVDSSAAPAFGIKSETKPYVHGLHSHYRHQLIYSIRGMLQLILESSQWFLPPQRAAWVPSGTVHETRFLTHISYRSIVFDPTFPGVPQSTCRVFSVTPLFQELNIFCMQWGADRDPKDKVANLFFQTIAALSAQLMTVERPFFLPRAKTPELVEALRYTQDNLHEVHLEDVAAVANLSVRSLRRHMEEETGISWQKFLYTARMIRAMELLANPEAYVTETALEVGYNSFSAFTQAFTRFTGETPRNYLQRIKA